MWARRHSAAPHRWTHTLDALVRGRTAPRAAEHDRADGHEYPRENDDHSDDEAGLVALGRLIGVLTLPHRPHDEPHELARGKAPQSRPGRRGVCGVWGGMSSKTVKTRNRRRASAFEAVRLQAPQAQNQEAMGSFQGSFHAPARLHTRTWKMPTRMYPANQMS